jgi:two-component system, cell cycle sensor histidine kinase and response regulator CckA
MRLKHRILLSFGALALLFICVMVGAFVVLERTTKNVDLLVDREFALSSLVDDSHRIVITIHAEVWDALLTATADRTIAKQRLDELAKQFYANLRQLRDRFPNDEPPDTLRRQFEGYYLLGSTILEFRDPAEFKSQQDVVGKFVSSKREVVKLLEQRVGPSKLSFKASLQRFKAMFDTAGWVVISILLLLLVTALGLSLLLSNRITRPIERLTATAKTVASGGFDVIVAAEEQTEIGTLARAFQVMLERVNITISAMRHEVRERTEAERGLQQAKDYLTAVLDSLSSVLVTIDRQGRVTHWNAKAHEVTGVASTKALGCPVTQLIPALESYEPRIKQVLQDGLGATYQREPWNVGKIRWVDIAIYPLAHAGGAVLRFDDATELEKKDEQLRHVQRMDTTSILAGGLAHDFNNILAAITGTVSLLKFDLQDGRLDQSTLDEHIDVISHATTRATDLVKGLLVLSRKQELTFRRVELSEVVERTIKLCRNTFDKSIEICVEPAATPMHVRADATQIAEVLLNLCINSWHAMTSMRDESHQQGGRLTVGLCEQVADTKFCSEHPGLQPGRYSVLFVRDNGVGMDRSTRERAFDPFFTTKAAGGGTGLGLAMAFNVVKLHGGFIDLYSELGSGSEFKVYLPLMDEFGRSVRDVEAQIVCGFGRILVVDDEEAVRNVAAKTLIHCGYQVVTAEGGAEALRLFGDSPESYQLVLLDMAMPEMSGLDVLKELKRISPAVRALMQSGFGADPRITRSLEVGALGVIQKPYTMAELSLRVKSALIS